MIANDVIASVSHSPCRQCTLITNCIYIFYIYKICRPLRSTNLGYISPDYTYVLSHFSIHHKSQRISAYTAPHSDRQYHNTPDDPASHPQHRIRHMPHMNAPITHIHMEIRNNRAFWKIQPDRWIGLTSFISMHTTFDSSCRGHYLPAYYGMHTCSVRRCMYPLF